MIDGQNERTNAALIHSEVAQVFLGLGFAKINQLTLDLGADHNRFSREVTLRVILNGFHVLRCIVAGVDGPGAAVSDWGYRRDGNEIRFRSRATNKRGICS